MGKLETTASSWAYVRAGAVAGAVSAFAFAIIHHIFISDIRFSLLLMVAGVLCGLDIGWSYTLLVEAPSIGSWLRYNMLYLAMFVSVQRLQCRFLP